MSAVSSAVEAAITGPAMVSARLTVVQQEDLRRRLVPSGSREKEGAKPAVLCHKDTAKGKKCLELCLHGIKYESGATSEPLN